MIYFSQRKITYFKERKLLMQLELLKTYKTGLLDLKPMYQSYRNQLINLHSKSIDLFPYDRYISFNALHFLSEQI